MKVDTAQNVTQPLLQSTATREKFQADFQATLETAKQSHAQAGGSSTPAKSTENKVSHKPTSQMTPAEYLADYVRKTPEQHMRDAILEQMGLTEEELAAMPPDKRAAIEHTIEEKIKEILQRQHGNKQVQGQQAFASIQSLSM